MLFERLFQPKHRSPESIPPEPPEELTPTPAAPEVAPTDDPTIAQKRQHVADSFAGNHFIDGAMIGPVHARPGSFLDNGFFRR